MIYRGQIVFQLFIVVFLLFTSLCSAQKGKEISFSVYPGYTLVNFEKAFGYSDDNMEDWNQICFSAAVRGFLLSEKTIQIGAEVARQKLYYAYYVVPYIPSPLHREFIVASTSIMILGRYFTDNFFVVGGAGIHFFDEGSSAAICLEAGYMLKISDNLKIPVSFRLNPVFGSGTPVPISLGAGLSYTLK